MRDMLRVHIEVGKSQIKIEVNVDETVSEPTSDLVFLSQWHPAIMACRTMKHPNILLAWIISQNILVFEEQQG